MLNRNILDFFLTPSTAGLLPFHAYACLDVRRTRNGDQLVKLKNPWAAHRWRGALRNATFGLNANLLIPQYHQENGLSWIETAGVRRRRKISILIYPHSTSSTTVCFGFHGKICSSASCSGVPPPMILLSSPLLAQVLLGDPYRMGSRCLPHRSTYRTWNNSCFINVRLQHSTNQLNAQSLFLHAAIEMRSPLSSLSPFSIQTH